FSRSKINWRCASNTRRLASQVFSVSLAHSVSCPLCSACWMTWRWRSMRALRSAMCPSAWTKCSRSFIAGRDSVPPHRAHNGVGRGIRPTLRLNERQYRGEGPHCPLAEAGASNYEAQGRPFLVGAPKINPEHLADCRALCPLDASRSIPPKPAICANLPRKPPWRPQMSARGHRCAHQTALREYRILTKTSVGVLDCPVARR